MPLVLQERELLFLFGIVLSTLVFVLFFQFIVRATSILCSWFGCVRWHYVSFVCVPLLMVASFHTGLTLYLLVMAIALVLVTDVTSWRMGASTFLLGFALVGFAMLQLVPSLHLMMPSETTTWVSRHYGQVALWPPYGAAGPRDLLVVYNDVTLTRLPCEDRGVETALDDAGSAMPSEMQTLVSFGDATRVYALEGCGDEIYNKKRRMHQVTLLGMNSRLEGIKVRCGPLTPEKKSMVAPGARCISVAVDTVFLDVEIEVYNASGHHVFTVHIRRADSCADAMDQIHRIKEEQLANNIPLLACFQNVGMGEFLHLLNNHQVVPAVLDSEVPYTLRCLWHMPLVLHTVHGVISYLVDRILVPVGALVAPRLCELASGVRVGVLCALSTLAPWVTTRVEDLQVVAVGAYCTATGSLHVSFCSPSKGRYADDWRYLMGSWFIDVLCDATRLALDAVEFVPGFWALHLWALRMEWSLTVFCVSAVQEVFVVGFTKVVWPLSQVLGVAVSSFAAQVFHVVAPLLNATDFSFLLEFLRRAAIFLWHTETELFAMEKFLLWTSFSHLCLWFAAALRFSFVVLSRGCTEAYRIWGLYTTTTLSSHVFVALIQTAIIVIAMRNELYGIASRDLKRYPTFISRYSGGVYIAMVTAFTRVYSIGIIRYAMAHIMLLSMLFGFSTLQLLSRLYKLTLYVGFPFLSSYVCLEFFVKTPQRRDVLRLSLARSLLVVIVDYTIGNFVAHLLRDVMFFLSLLLFLVGAFWVWREKLHLRVLNTCQRLWLETSARDVETVLTSP